MSINPIYVPQCLIYFLESHIHFPELFIEVLERFGFLARLIVFLGAKTPRTYLDLNCTCMKYYNWVSNCKCMKLQQTAQTEMYKTAMDSCANMHMYGR